MSNPFRYYIPERGETVADAVTFTSIWDTDYLAYVAEAAAEHEYQCRDGRNAEWPLVLVLLDVDGMELGRFHADLNYVPEFSACPVKEPAA